MTRLTPSSATSYERNGGASSSRVPTLASSFPKAPPIKAEVVVAAASSAAMKAKAVGLSAASASRRTVVRWYDTNVRETVEFYSSLSSSSSSSSPSSSSTLSHALPGVDVGIGGGGDVSSTMARRVDSEDEEWVHRRLDRRSEALLLPSSSRRSAAAAAAAAVGVAVADCKSDRARLSCDRASLAYVAPRLLDGDGPSSSRPSFRLDHTSVSTMPPLSPSPTSCSAASSLSLPEARVASGVCGTDTYVKMEGEGGESATERAILKAREKVATAAAAATAAAVVVVAEGGWNFRRRRRGTGASASVTIGGGIGGDSSGGGRSEARSAAHEGYVNLGDENRAASLERTGVVGTAGANGGNGDGGGGGEVEELRLLLRTVCVQREEGKRRHVLRAVLAAMSRGVDVGPLLPEMVLAVETRDLIAKKMVYHFLCNYAAANPDMAQMCTNTLWKDCDESDPTVRGLALRSLCSMDVPEMTHLAGQCLRKALDDAHPNVRRTAAMCALKLRRMDQKPYDRSKLAGALRHRFDTDDDALVVCNCARALEEMEPGCIDVNSATVHRLLRRLDSFDRFDVPVILDLVRRFEPDDEAEYRFVTEALDPLLRTAHSSVLLAVVRALLSLTCRFWRTRFCDSGKEGKHEDEDEDEDESAAAAAAAAAETSERRSAELRRIVEKVRAPLVTHAASASASKEPEIAYVLLRHIAALAGAMPDLFQAEHRHLYVRAGEPSYVQREKAALLPRLVNAENASDIASELVAYIAGSRDADLRLISVRSLGCVARRTMSLCSDAGDKERGNPDIVRMIADWLFDLLDSVDEPIRVEALTMLANMLRANPASLAPQILPRLGPRILNLIKPWTDPTALATSLRILAEFGERIPRAPYLLERIINSYSDLPDKVGAVKSTLVTATTLLFLRRPPEVRAMLGRLLAVAVRDRNDSDARGRAAFCYRLLRASATDVAHARAVLEAGLVSTGCYSGGNFVEEDDSELCAGLLMDFDSFGVVFGTVDHSKDQGLSMLKIGPKTVVCSVEGESGLNGGRVDGLAPSNGRQFVSVEDTTQINSPVCVVKEDALDVASSADNTVENWKKDSSSSHGRDHSCSASSESTSHDMLDFDQNETTTENEGTDQVATQTEDVSCLAATDNAGDSSKDDEGNHATNGENKITTSVGPFLIETQDYEKGLSQSPALHIRSDSLGNGDDVSCSALDNVKRGSKLALSCSGTEDPSVESNIDVTETESGMCSSYAGSPKSIHSSEEGSHQIIDTLVSMTVS